MVIQELTWAEVHRGALEGVRRNLADIVVGRPHRAEYIGDGWGNHIRGAIAEEAVAKWRNRYWGLHDDPGHGDVGQAEVRHTEQPDGRLILRPGDPADRAYILVTGQAPVLAIVGWVNGRDAMVDAHWTDAGTGRPPAWFVPQAALHLVKP